MTNLAEMLSRLDASQDEAERLIGADWLEEQGYAQEARFYRWLVTAKLEPFYDMDDVRSPDYYWVDQCFATDYFFGPFPEQIEQARIVAAELWAKLYEVWTPTPAFHVLGYPTRSKAIECLRLAYLCHADNRTINEN